MEDEDESEENDEPQLDIQETKELSRKGVLEVWSQFMEKFQQEDENMHRKLFKGREIEIHTTQKFIAIHFENRVQLDHFEELKTDLLFYLRQNLSNPDLHVTATVAEQKVDSKRLYTDKDKLEFLIEKKPIIQELKDKLGLDVEY